MCRRDLRRETASMPQKHSEHIIGLVDYGGAVLQQKVLALTSIFQVVMGLLLLSLYNSDLC